MLLEVLYKYRCSWQTEHLTMYNVMCTVCWHQIHDDNVLYFTESQNTSADCLTVAEQRLSIRVLMDYYIYTNKLMSTNISCSNTESMKRFQLQTPAQSLQSQCCWFQQKPWNVIQDTESTGWKENKMRHAHSANKSCALGVKMWCVYSHKRCV